MMKCRKIEQGFDTPHAPTSSLDRAIPCEIEKELIVTGWWDERLAKALPTILSLALASFLQAGYYQDSRENYHYTVASHNEILGGEVSRGTEEVKNPEEQFVTGNCSL